MNKSRSPDKKRLGAYAKAALSFLGRAAATGIVFAFSSLESMAEDFKYHNRYGKNYIGRRRPYARRVMRQTVMRLRARGYIRVVARGDEVFLQLTAEGRSAIEKMRMGELKIIKPRVWDKTWHLVAFDVPENEKGARNAFRQRLIELGFTKIEKSLFVIPYPCEKEIVFLTKHFAIVPYVHFIKAISFNGDHRLQELYELAWAGDCVSHYKTIGL